MAKLKVGNPKLSCYLVGNTLILGNEIICFDTPDR